MGGFHRSTTAAACLLVALVGVPRATPAQQGPASESAAGPRSAAALAPDTVRVGDPFTLGLSIAGPETASVRFPPLIELGAELEQLSPVQVEWYAVGGGQWRARYRLAAWRAGTRTLPAVPVEWQGSQIVFQPPSVHVTTVLPAASEDPLPLEGPRGPAKIRGFPWWLLLLLVAMLFLWWLLRRLRRPEEEEAVVWVDPSVTAREALARLKRDLESGDLDLAAFYDGLEEVLRTYLASRRGWPVQRPVRDFVREAGESRSLPEVEAGLRSIQRRAGLVRFAHVAAAESMALGDADACLAWVEAEEAEAA